MLPPSLQRGMGGVVLSPSNSLHANVEKNLEFIERLTSPNILMLDGAMGTELDKRGLMGRSEANLTIPADVVEVHRAYVDAGAQAVITNTLTMNRVYIESHNIDVDLQAVNRMGVELARRAVDEGQYVLGNMSSTGKLLDPFGTHSEEDFEQAFGEQAELLSEAGVDAIAIETMFDLREALCALRACKQKTDLPVIVGIAYKTEEREGRTMMGASAADCAQKLTDSGADVIGANCGDVDPTQMARIIDLMRKETDLPILAEPNAGKPKLIDGQTWFDMEPVPFAAGVGQCLDAGATIIGGCCGTTPDHIRAVADLIQRRADRN